MGNEHRAGVPYEEVKAKFMENEEFRKEYEKLGKGLLIKEAEEKVKILFITENQYGVLESFLRYMEFEDGTSIRVVGEDKSIFINTCGMDITIMSLEMDTYTIGKRFNFIFVDLKLNYGTCDVNGLVKIFEYKELSDFINSTITVINMFEVNSLCENFFDRFGEKRYEI